MRREDYGKVKKVQNNHNKVSRANLRAKDYDKFKQEQTYHKKVSIANLGAEDNEKILREQIKHTKSSLDKKRENDHEQVKKDQMRRKGLSNRSLKSSGQWKGIERRKKRHKSKCWQIARKWPWTG